MQSQQASLVSLWAAADSMNFVLRKHSLDTVAPLTYYGFTTSPAGDFWDGPKVDSDQRLLDDPLLHHLPIFSTTGCLIYN